MAAQLNIKFDHFPFAAWWQSGEHGIQQVTEYHFNVSFLKNLAYSL